MRCFGLMCGAIVLAGCLPLSTYYREGATLAKVEADEVACQVQALKDVPVRERVFVDPPVYVPPRKHCDVAGHCVVRGGFFHPGSRYVVDVNEDLRARVTSQCMADRGYAPVRIPACPAGVASAAPEGRTEVFPKLNEQSCVIRNSDGTVQIVTRG